MSDAPKMPTIAELLEKLPELLLEDSRRHRERAIANARRMQPLWDYIAAHDIKLSDLPSRAIGLIWVLETGEPIHPKAAEYLNSVLLSAGNSESLPTP